MPNHLLNLALSVIQIGEGLIFDGYTLSAAPIDKIVTNSISAPAQESLTLAGNNGNGARIILGVNQDIDIIGTIRGLTLNVKTKSENYVIEKSDYLIVYTGSNAGTFTLPTVTNNTGSVFSIKNRGSGILTVQSLEADKIFSTTNISSFDLQVGLGATFVCDGTYWLIVSMAAGSITS